MDVYKDDSPGDHKGAGDEGVHSSQITEPGKVAAKHEIERDEQQQDGDAEVDALDIFLQPEGNPGNHQDDQHGNKDSHYVVKQVPIGSKAQREARMRQAVWSDIRVDITKGLEDDPFLLTELVAYASDFWNCLKEEF